MLYLASPVQSAPGLYRLDHRWTIIAIAFGCKWYDAATLQVRFSQNLDFQFPMKKVRGARIHPVPQHL
jgi:hypothetical protein